jgi:hypothetical protein
MRRTFFSSSTALFCSALLLTGCFGGQGMRVGADGSMKLNTPQVAAEDTANHIRASLEHGFGKGWTVEVTFDPELPTYDVVEADEFGWGSLTATVVCRSTGIKPTKDTPEDVSKAVRDYLRHKVRRPADRNLKVETRFETVAAPVPEAPAVVGAAKVPGSRIYTAQPGDSWADLSTAFYGSPDHWRRIKDANPALTEGLVAGATVTIPPKP